MVPSKKRVLCYAISYVTHNWKELEHKNLLKLKKLHSNLNPDFQPSFCNNISQNAQPYSLIPTSPHSLLPIRSTTNSPSELVYSSSSPTFLIFKTSHYFPPHSLFLKTHHPNTTLTATHIQQRLPTSTNSTSPVFLLPSPSRNRTVAIHFKHSPFKPPRCTSYNL